METAREPTTMPRTTTIGGLAITYDDGVLEPRPWTALQGEWAAELAATAPAGPLLEVCSGAGHIGLIAAARSGRQLVQVDADPGACRFALANATANGLAHLVDIHCATIEQVQAWGEHFPLVIADPPYIRTAEVEGYPDDPRAAIDGGADGLDLARQCLELFRRVLMPGGHALLQLGARAHVDALASACRAPLRLTDRRDAGASRQVAAFVLADG